MPKKIVLNRVQIEETGQVLRWYESSDEDAVVSITEGDNPKNVEWRVSRGNIRGNSKFQTFLGSKETFEKKSESEIKKKSERLVNTLQK